mmetsp:Transcript_95651/g.117208  ORF Transcript_95651/g.117208 Transcript_95651/m.117208 type:complete len:237 (-) Transcript_95651:11-721(-)
MLAAQERCILCQLTQAGEKFCPLEGSAEAHVDQDLQRSIEGTNVVLTAVVTNGGLKGRGDIVHGQQGGWNIDQFASAVENGGKKAGHVHQGTSTKSNDQRLLGGSDAKAPLNELRQVVPRFGFITTRKHEFVQWWHTGPQRGVATATGSTTLHHWGEIISMQLVHGCFRDQQNSVRFHLQNLINHLGLHVHSQPTRHFGTVRELEVDLLHYYRSLRKRRGRAVQGKKGGRKPTTVT